MAISDDEKRIIIRKNGPYRIQGNIPLVRKIQVVSEYGEPLTWKNEGALETEEGEYFLCRCGQSSHKPFCDSTHRQISFDGTERAPLSPTA
jgi:CDGSH-type Zn-finger protein